MHHLIVYLTKIPCFKVIKLGLYQNQVFQVLEMMVSQDKGEVTILVAVIQLF
jgi:hypothetical protein